ncbi:hypothetical protein ARMA_1266 [Ardenticatena maritima]|uniref:Uncharacterized protein n=1 Tax=Ardenticatena maritima TaxID=872965 RepID=A0A0M8K6K4_9CHLR|nr:hypothetical protein ARMA_1266 [Ardenticatena maritima]
MPFVVCPRLLMRAAQRIRKIAEMPNGQARGKRKSEASMDTSL